MTTKVVRTTVTDAQVMRAHGGTGGTDRLVWVSCPEHYDAAAITAEDIIGDTAVTVVCDECHRIHRSDWPCGAGPDGEVQS